MARGETSVLYSNILQNTCYLVGFCGSVGSLRLLLTISWIIASASGDLRDSKNFFLIESWDCCQNSTKLFLHFLFNYFSNLLFYSSWELQHLILLVQSLCYLTRYNIWLSTTVYTIKGNSRKTDNSKYRNPGKFLEYLCNVFQIWVYITHYITSNCFFI